MGGNFSYESKIIAWQDTAAQQNPQQRVLDWHKTQVGVPFTLASSRILTVDPGQTVSLPITAASAIAGTSSFDVTQNTVKSNTYRFTLVAGTLVVQNDLSGATNVEIAPRSDGYVAITLDLANLTVVAGGRIFIPGVATGDAAGPFNEANVGNWRIVSVSANGLTVIVSPLNGQAAVAETVVATGAEVQSYPVGPDVGWFVYGKQGDWYGTFEVTGLTGTWMELKRPTTIPLPAALPTTLPQQIGGATVWYWASSWPKLVRVEADGVVEVIGLTAQSVPYSIIPFVVGDADQMGWIEMVGAAVAPTPASISNGGYRQVKVNVFVIY